MNGGQEWTDLPLNSRSQGEQLHLSRAQYCQSAFLHSPSIGSDEEGNLWVVLLILDGCSTWGKHLPPSLAPDYIHNPSRAWPADKHILEMENMRSSHHPIWYELSLLLHWTRCHDLGSNLWGKKVFSRKFYLGWTVLWGWGTGVIHNSFDDWGTVMGLCKMFISPHGRTWLCNTFRVIFTGHVCGEWLKNGWGGSGRGLGASLLASVLPLLHPSPIVHHCVSHPLSCHCLWIKSALRCCQSESACVCIWPHVGPTSAGGAGLVCGCRWSVVWVGGWKCALKPQGSPPWSLCSSSCSQSSLPYTCDIMIVSTATNYDDINKPSMILLHCIEERWKVMNNRLGLLGKK